MHTDADRTSSVLAIIPLYRRKDQLDKCLAALSHSTVPVEPFVHDNSDNNIGWTKANNIGLKLALQKRCTYALLLNQDCYVRPDCVANLIRFMEAHPDCAIAGPKQVAGADEDHIIHAGCREAFPAGFNFQGRKSKGECTRNRCVPWVNGAAMFVRMDAVIEIGLLDPNMFLIGSDSDWCFTARARGFSVWYCAEAECVHESATGISLTSTQNEDMQSLFRRDMLYWRDKWIGTELYDKLRTEPGLEH